MKVCTSTSRVWTSVALVALVAAAGCSKKDKDDDDSGSDAAVDTSIVESAVEGDVAMIKYSSNTAGVTYKCQTEVNGQVGPWQDCDAAGTQIQLAPGARTVFRVKAIAADGSEDKVPSERVYDRSQQGGQGGDLVTSILNKSEVGQIVTVKTLTLAFGTEGADVDADDLRYECKLAPETEFRRCPDGASYTFADLTDGGTYDLTVRAVHRPTNTVATEDQIVFKVQLQQIDVKGEDQLQQAEQALRNGQNASPVNLEISAAEGSTVTCKFDQEAEQACPSPLVLDLNQIPDGAHTIAINAKGADGKQAASRTVNFCVKDCKQTGGGPVLPPPVTRMQIGSFYEYVIPEGMHVTQYATTKGYNTSLRFYRVLPESDPYAIGNYACRGERDSKLSATSPGGETYDYCLTTPPRDYYKVWLADYRMANNHLELGPDRKVVESNPQMQDRTLINVFDRDYEFMYGRSRFEELCLNKRGTIQRSKPIRFINNDFWGESVKAEFWMCVSELAGSGPGLPGANDEWWVGAFFITSEGLDLPLHECITQTTWCDENGVYHNYNPTFCGQYKNPSLLEVTFMTKKPFFEASDFARYAQSQFVKNLQEIVPVQ